MFKFDTIPIENPLINKNQYLVKIPFHDTIYKKEDLVVENALKVYGHMDFKYDKFAFNDDNELVELLKENRNLYKQLNKLKTPLEKKLISTKEFTEIYGISAETQKQLRRRDKHALPYIQIQNTGPIKYKIKVIDKWLENYEKNI